MLFCLLFPIYRLECRAGGEAPWTMWMRFLRRNRTNRMHMRVSDICVLYIYFICLHTHTCKEIYYKELTHSIMDVDKSQVLQLARWRPRRANDVVLVQRPANSRPRKNQCFSSSPKVGKDQCSSLEAVRQEEFPLIWQGVGDQPFCSSQAFKWLAHHIWEGTLLYYVYHFKC